jgi:two-component system response regulator GlrR
MLRRLTLLVEDTLAVETGIPRLLTNERGYACSRESWATFQAKRLTDIAVDLVISVAPSLSESALFFHDWLRTHSIGAPVLIVLPREPSEALVRSASLAADDFLLSPVRDEELLCRLDRLLGATRNPDTDVQRKLNRELGLKQLIGEAPDFLQQIEKIPAIARSSAPVLLMGETGTGKELCAHAIHSLSNRGHGPFVPVDCGAVPEQLLENELFGHARGAFTDAHSDQKGLAAFANGGTLFLDEIDSLTLVAQSKLLRFIETGAYRPLGTYRQEPADVRLIAATNRDLEECCRLGVFRRDLFFRLNVLPLRLPPLRFRRSDIAPLAQHFLETTGPEAVSPRKFTASALRALQSHDWPGNVRELYNVVRRAVAFSGGSPILPAHLGLGITAAASPSEMAFHTSKQQAIAKFEKQYVEELLRKHHGNVTHAATDAQKDRRVFGRLIKKYQIDRRDL